MLDLPLVGLALGIIETLSRGLGVLVIGGVDPAHCIRALNGRVDGSGPCPGTSLASHALVIGGVDPALLRGVLSCLPATANTWSAGGPVDVLGPCLRTVLCKFVWYMLGEPSGEPRLARMPGASIPAVTDVRTRGDTGRFLFRLDANWCRTRSASETTGVGTVPSTGEFSCRCDGGHRPERRL